MPALIQDEFTGLPPLVAWRKRNPEKVAAHQQVNLALKRGDLVRQPCEHCGRAKAHAHHADYSKPLEVQWLCPQCHGAEHSRMRDPDRAARVAAHFAGIEQRKAARAAHWRAFYAADREKAQLRAALKAERAAQPPTAPSVSPEHTHQLVTPRG